MFLVVCIPFLHITNARFLLKPSTLLPKKNKKALKKYAKGVKVSPIKGLILGSKGAAIQITVKGKQGITDKQTFKMLNLMLLKCTGAIKKADFKDFNNIRVGEKM